MVDFYISYRIVTVPPASSLAGMALRSGKLAVGRSFRFHRPRGALCARGYCGFCSVETPAGRALACELPGEAEARLGGRDLLRLLGRVAERWPPWFYERRFLRPKAARRLYLELLRRASAAGRLGPWVEGARVKHFLEETCESVVVGEGGNVDGVPLGIYEERVLAVVRDDAIVAIHFDSLVLRTGAYERLPPIPGNDLPGVVGLAALERFAREGTLPEGLRLAVWAPLSVQEGAIEVAKAAGSEVVWKSSLAPSAIIGRERVEAVWDGGRVPCDLVVVDVGQPAIELALQAGASATLSREGLPILSVTETPPWLRLEGAAAATSSGVPDVRPDDEAFACLCEDVRVRDIRRAIADGFAHPELVKRRTGALTGFCQGKLCAPTVLQLMREAGLACDPTTPRPPAKPMRLADIAADA
jgi:bacterioferritin-associated ferredoxin